jgi:hypothetical protein
MKPPVLARVGPAVLALLVAGEALVDYHDRLAPGLTCCDEAEFQALSWALGVPHGTSYPLYIWLARAAELLPMGSVAHRANMFSAFCGAGAVLLLYALIAELLTTDGWVRWVAAAAAAGLYAHIHTVWSVARVAHVYALHSLLCLSLLYALVRWSSRREPLWLWVAAGTFGALAGNHASAIALVPGVVSFVLSRRSVPPLDDKRKALGLAGFTLFVASFSCIFLFWLLWRRHVRYDHWNTIIQPAWELFGAPENKRGSFWYAWKFETTCRQFGHDMLSTPVGWPSTQIALAPHRIIAEYSPVAALLGVVGWGIMWRRDWRFNVMATVSLLTLVWLVCNYYNPKAQLYFLLPYALFAVWIGAALSTLCLGIESLVQRCVRSTPAVRVLTAVGLAGILALCLHLHRRSVVSYADWLKSHEQISDAVSASLESPAQQPLDPKAELARRILSQLPSNAILFTYWDLVYPINYLAHVEQHLDGLEVYEFRPHTDQDSSPYPPAFARRIEKEVDTRPIYSTQVEPDFPPGFRFEPMGEKLYRIERN